MKPDLHIVGRARQTPSKRAPNPEPEDLLALLVPELQAAEDMADAIRKQVDDQRRKLADKRNVAFIRIERVIEEFGQ